MAKRKRKNKHRVEATDKRTTHNKPRKLARRNVKKAAIRLRQEQILKMYSQGTPVETIAQELDLSTAHVVNSLNTAIDRMIAHYAQSSPQQTFVRYAAFQMAIIKKLQATWEAYVNDPTIKQYNAAISALRTQSDVYDKIMNKGVEYGVIEKKKADRKAIEGKAQDIKGELILEITQLQRLVGAIDDVTQAQAILTQERRTITKVSYTKKIRKPLVNQYGIVRALPDWKYRTKLYREREDGKYIEATKDSLSPEEQELLPEPDIDNKLQKELLREEGKVLVESKRNQPIILNKPDNPLAHPSRKKKDKRTTTQQQDNPEIVVEEDNSNSSEESNWLIKPR